MKLVVDTGILLAAANRSDKWHSASVELLNQRYRDVVVPAPVVVETSWLIAREMGNRAEASFVESFGREELTLENMLPTDYRRAAELLMTYESSNLGLVDVCVAAVAERIGAVEIATINPRDFRIIRPANGVAFLLLP